MSEFEDDLRHAEANDAARDRAAEKLKPAMDKYIAGWLEVEVKDLPRVRDHIKAGLIRDDRKKLAGNESIKWIVGGVLGAIVTVLTWIAAHIQIGGPK